MKAFKLFIDFWFNHPALFYGCTFYLGICCHLDCSLWLLIPCLSLWLPLVLASLLQDQRHFVKHIALSFLVFATAWAYSAAYYSFPSLSDNVLGIGKVKIRAISLQNSPFGERWIYRCELNCFFPGGSVQSIASSLPCVITLPNKNIQNNERPLANRDYWIKGKLVRDKNGITHLKALSKTKWLPVESSWSPAEWRHRFKNRVSRWIEGQFTHRISGSFLAGLATGEFDDFWMRGQFARFGLQHLLAISGFHFSIIAGFLSFVLRIFFSETIRFALLFFLLTFYCWFLGPQASILRAWIMCSLVVLGGLMHKQSTALNSLGFALLVILSYHPLLCLELGFQLSFGTTAAILLFFHPAQSFMNELFTKKRLADVIEMNHFNQYAYCILAFLRQGLALTLAVNAFALPLTLYHFNQFPWMSLLYNLFYPFMASGSLCLLLLGMLLGFIPFLANMIHSMNDSYTFFLLQLTYQIPKEMDAYLTTESINSLWLALYMCLITLGGIAWHQKTRSQEEFATFI